MLKSGGQSGERAAFVHCACDARVASEAEAAHRAAGPTDVRQRRIALTENGGEREHSDPKGTRVRVK